MTEAVRAALVGFGVFVGIQAALGFCGWLTAPLAIGAFLIAALAAARSWRGDGSSSPASRPVWWPPPDRALFLAITAALGARLFGGLRRGDFLYDTLVCHLYFPAAWMHDRRLSVVPTLFGDVAAAYTPSNAELVFHLLMAPFRSDYFAKVGQLPFAALSVLAIAATVREQTGDRRAALGSGLAFLLIPGVWQQAATAMVDLAMVAFFLAALPFLTRLWRTPSVRDATALALAFGLFVGTKFVSLTYSLPLVMAGLAILARHRHLIPDPTRAAWDVIRLGAIVVATGGFWYLRNLLMTGNPLYPVTLRLFGRPLFAGLYDPALMREWFYHVPIGSLGVPWRMLVDGGIGFGVAALVAGFVQRRSPMPWLAALLFALFWLVLPYQQARFLFPFFGVAAITIGGAAATLQTRGNTTAAVVLLATATLIPVVESHTAARLAAVAAAFVGMALPRIARRIPLRVASVTGGSILAIALSVGLVRNQRAFPGYAVGDDRDAAWSWLFEHLRERRIAYTGMNLPFPLYGWRLANDVRYVNVALGPEARLHDFPCRAENAEPTCYRKIERYDDWLANLRALERDTLFVSSLYPSLARSIGHDAEGFPVERAWTDANPETFQLLWANKGVRIYTVALPR